MKLPESNHSTSAAIVKFYESKPQEHRAHMGASTIGHACSRFIWNTWRWVLRPSFPGRVLRMFDTGNREETRLLTELRAIGADVWERDPSTRRQWRVTACNGHFGGSLDGVAKGLPEAPKSAAVLEFKTHNDKSFNDLVSKKVQGSKPQHYDQMQIYMGLMDIDRALYMGVNKNTDDVYCEWVHLDKERFDWLLDRAQSLIDLPQPPDKISADPAYYICKGCTFWEHCHGGVAAEANCRTCCHATPVENGAWHCQNHDAELKVDFQRDGCKDHLLIPPLVPYGDPVDGGENWVAYRHKTKDVMFVNGPEGCSDFGPVFASKELHRCPGELIADMSSLKNEFPGSKVISGGLTQKPAPAFDDIESDDPDTLPVRAAKPAEKKMRQKSAALLTALQDFAK